MEAESPKGTKSSPHSRTFFFVGVLATSLLVGGSLFFYLRNSRRHSPPESRKVNTVVHLDSFVVNLADEGQHTYLRLSLDLGLEESGTEKSSEATVPISPLRDSLLEVLMSTRSEDLATVEGRQKLKETMLQKLNAHVPEAHVREIYFTEFLIQK